jgi:hypothetical protein
MAIALNFDAAAVYVRPPRRYLLLYADCPLHPSTTMTLLLAFPEAGAGSALGFVFLLATCKRIFRAARHDADWHAVELEGVAQ